MKNRYQTALLLTALLHRSAQKRARVSQKTMRLLSSRSRLHAPFVSDVADHCAELGVSLVELGNGAFGLFPSSILEGAPAITAKKYFTDEEKAKLRSGNFDFDNLEVELGLHDDQDGAEE